MVSHFIFFLWKHLSHTCMSNRTNDKEQMACLVQVSSLSQLARQIFIHSNKQHIQLLSWSKCDTWWALWLHHGGADDDMERAKTQRKARQQSPWSVQATVHLRNLTAGCRTGIKKDVHVVKFSSIVPVTIWTVWMCVFLSFSVFFFFSSQHLSTLQNLYNDNDNNNSNQHHHHQNLTAWRQKPLFLSCRQVEIYLFFYFGIVINIIVPPCPCSRKLGKDLYKLRAKGSS